MFLKAMVHLSSSPLKMVESSSQRTKTRILPASGDMVKPLQHEGVAAEVSSIGPVIAVSLQITVRASGILLGLGSRFGSGHAATIRVSVGRVDASSWLR